MKIQQTIQPLTQGHRQKSDRCGLHTRWFTS